MNRLVQRVQSADVRAGDVGLQSQHTHAVTLACMLCCRLPEMTSLTSLSLEGCGRITEKALDAIVSHPSLRHLNVRGCSCFGYYGVIALEASDIDFLM